LFEGELRKNLEK